MAFKKYLRVDPYLPDRTEALGDNTGQFSDKDIGKPVKQNAAGYLELCASGDEIYGFVTAVEPATEDGHSIGSVSCNGGNVIAASVATAVHAWIVEETYGGAAGDKVLLRKV